jgi:hypothetical protein
MKTVLRSALAAAALVAAFAAPAAQAQTPITFNYNGVFDPPTVVSLQPLTMYLVSRVTGISSHMGYYSGIYPHDVNLENGLFSGTFTMTAANGDQLFVNLGGTAVPTSAGDYNIRFVGTITGGNGRFVGASGSVTGAGAASLATLTVHAQFSGALINP